jgi:glycosyltransferase involved in cell wall biosynthesis/2-polyprenyl-3-methyl-5-hydroxy-6-metoxy-1,4-benzoquinol methylase
MKLSILIPVYNERALAARSIAAVLAAPLPPELERELVIVDDRSTDGTSAILEKLAAEEPRIRLFRHAVNQGKGAAVRTAIEKAEGDFCLIQDADLEYDPNDYPALMRPLLEGQADAVFGSRYMAGERRRILPYWHTKINQFLTLFSNMFCNLDITDMETCYKAFRTDLLKSIPIRSDRFGIEPEITMKCAKRRLRIYEVPISYHGRTYEEGKKIGWRDGLKALGVVFYFWLIDDLYTNPYGRAHLNNLTGTPNYVAWVVSLIRPEVRDTVLELSAGIGTMTGHLMGRRMRYVAGEKDPLYLHALRNRFLRTPTVEVQHLTPDAVQDYAGLQGQFDTVLCLNVLEYAEDPEAVVANAARCLQPGGKLVVLAPQCEGIFGGVDRTMGHRRRFSAATLRAMVERAGLTMERRHSINKISTPVWWLTSRLLGMKQISKLSMKMFDWTVWFWRAIDKVMPWPGLSMIVVAKKGS